MIKKIYQFLKEKIKIRRKKQIEKICQCCGFNKVKVECPYCKKRILH